MLTPQQRIGYVTALKSGRAFNGAHRDSGRLVHLVPPLSGATAGFWGSKALCGTIPGYRGNGWHEVNKPVSCARCIEMAKDDDAGITFEDYTPLTYFVRRGGVCFVESSADAKLSGVYIMTIRNEQLANIIVKLINDNFKP